MKANLLLFFILVSTFSLEAQNSVKNPSLTPDLGSNYQFISFTIYGLESERETQNLLNDLSSNENLKKVEISSHFQFKSYVKKGYSLELNLLLKEKGYSTSMQFNHPLSVDKESRVVVIPEDMKPVFKDTGHPEKDKQRYTKAKKQLLLEHPEYIKQ